MTSRGSDKASNFQRRSHRAVIEHVFLENHALVIGDINTTGLTIEGGAIIEGRCYFDPSEQVAAPLEDGKLSN